MFMRVRVLSHARGRQLASNVTLVACDYSTLGELNKRRSLARMLRAASRRLRHIAQGSGRMWYQHTGPWGLANILGLTPAAHLTMLMIVVMMIRTPAHGGTNDARVATAQVPAVRPPMDAAQGARAGLSALPQS